LNKVLCIASLNAYPELLAILAILPADLGKLHFDTTVPGGLFHPSFI
jgi:hypothetical protein